MKVRLLAIVLAAGLSGSISMGNAQEVKKLRPHPDAAADKSTEQGSVALPAADASHAGGAAEHARPQTGEPRQSGGQSTGQSKQ